MPAAATDRNSGFINGVRVTRAEAEALIKDMDAQPLTGVVPSQHHGGQFGLTSGNYVVFGIYQPSNGWLGIPTPLNENDFRFSPRRAEFCLDKETATALYSFLKNVLKK